MQQTRPQGIEANRINPDQIAIWNRVLFTACLRNVKAWGSGNRFNEVLQWASVSGWFASRRGWFGELSSSALEAELLRAARSLPPASRGNRAYRRTRWLHVLSEAYGTLGHTNLCRRWIQYDTALAHDVILLDQKGEAPANLVEAVEESGGRCVVLDAGLPLLQRASELRAYAWENADVVVLHIHPEDVIATTAFGVGGGPPVLFVNHADHTFWVGCAVADLVLDIRASGHFWTKQARGVERALMMPLPLVNSEQEPRQRSDVARQRVRRHFAIPDDATVLLTVGHPLKYEPISSLNFLDTAVRILQQCGNARLVAVGPGDSGAWRAAKQATGGRVLGVGYQDSALFCRAADLYLEGFPAGSLTALLEAGEAGLACVRAPREVVPPFSSDGLGLDEVKQPRDVEDYVRTAVGLAQDANARVELGKKLQHAIRSHHCGEGWLGRLREVKGLIPERHSVYPDFRPTPVEQHRRDWLIQYLHRNDPQVSISTIAAEAFIEAWKRTTGEPQIDKALWAALKACECGEVHGFSTEIGLGVDTVPHCDPGATHGAVRTPRPKQCFLSTFQDAATLWWLNKRIRRRGLRERLMANASLALASGRQDLARKLTYACLLKRISSLSDLAWIRMLVKTHISPRWLGGVKRMWKGEV